MHQLFHISSPDTLQPPFFPLPNPQPWLLGCVFTDHLCISRVTPVDEVMHEPPEPSCPPLLLRLWLQVRIQPPKCCKRDKIKKYERPRP